MNQKGTLTFFCGKMGAGKSTISKTEAAEKNAIRISEDEWLAAHYPGLINSFNDYLKFSSLIKPFVKAHAQQVLNLGINVVMDFPANTVSQRKWFQQLCSEVGSDHELYYLDLSDEQCLAQISKRRIEQPERAQFDNEAVFKQVTKFFEAPTRQEGLNIVSITRNK